MKLNYLLLHIRNILLFFSYNLGFVFPPIYISVKQEAMAGKFHVHNHSGALNIVNLNGNIKWEIFYSLEFLGVPIIVFNVYLRKIFIS